MMLIKYVLCAQLYIVLAAAQRISVTESPRSSSDVKNFYKKFVMDPSYHWMHALRRKDLNTSHLGNLPEVIQSVPDVSTTPFDPETVNSFGPLELYQTDKNVPSSIDVYSRKKMLNQIMNKKMQEMSSGHGQEQEEPHYTYEPEYHYGWVGDADSSDAPESLYEQYEVVQDPPMYVSQIPRPKPKPHPRPYDWENYRRRPKLQELPPSYVIVGSPVPDPPEMAKEPVKTEEEKISDYEKDYKVLPSGINSYLKRKLKFEVDWVTIAKILLKLIIFKKILKFIIILGLLLFVPKYYKWSNTYLNDSVNSTYEYANYDKWHHKWDKFHQYKYPRRKRRTTTTTTTTTSTTSTTTEKNCHTSSTTVNPTTTSSTTTTTTEPR